MRRDTKGPFSVLRAAVKRADGPVAVVPGRPEDTLAGTVGADGSVALTGAAHRVAWSARADRVVAIVATDQGDVYQLKPN